mgnify:CR=1 FL=1
MKKQVLLSVFAAALFAAPTALATNTGQHNSADDNATSLKGADLFTNDKDGLTQYGKDGLNNVDAGSTKAKFKAAGEDLVKLPGKDEYLVKGAAKKAMAAKAGAKKPAGKVLPKTSAAK